MEARCDAILWQAQASRPCYEQEKFLTENVTRNLEPAAKMAATTLVGANDRRFQPSASPARD